MLTAVVLRTVAATILGYASDKALRKVEEHLPPVHIGRRAYVRREDLERFAARVHGKTLPRGRLDAATELIEVDELADVERRIAQARADLLRIKALVQSGEVMPREEHPRRMGQLAHYAKTQANAAAVQAYTALRDVSGAEDVRAVLDEIFGQLVKDIDAMARHLVAESGGVLPG